MPKRLNDNITMPKDICVYATIEINNKTVLFRELRTEQSMNQNIYFDKLPGNTYSFDFICRTCNNELTDKYIKDKAVEYLRNKLKNITEDNQNQLLSIV